MSGNLIKISKALRSMFFVLLCVMMVVGCTSPTPTAVPPTNTVAALPTDTPVPSTAALPTTSPAILILANAGTIVRNFNPFVQNSMYAALVSIYEPLLIFDTVAGEFIPWLATEYKYNSDATKLTYTIRQGVKWSDGQDFSVNDIVFTYQLLQKFPALDTGVVWANLASVSAPDSNTVEFEFKQAFIPGLLNISRVPIVAEHIWKDITDPTTFTNENPVGTGPFTQVTALTESYYQMEKNPYYWQPGKPYFQGYKDVNVGTSDTMIMALAKGEIDWTSNFIPDIQNSYAAKDPEHNKWAPVCEGQATFIYMNTTKKPFDDVNVRKAISMALDRETMLHTALYDYSSAMDATGLATRFSNWKDPNIIKNNADLLTLNPDKANQMLDAAGLKKGAGGFRTLPDGTPLHFYIDNAGWTDYAAISQIVAQNLKQVGFNAEARSTDPNTWFDKIGKGDFDLFVAWSSTGSTPYETYRGLMSSQTYKPIGVNTSENWGRVKSTQADDLLLKLASTADPVAAKAIAYQLEQIFVDVFPAAPIYDQCSLAEWNTSRFTDWPDPTKTVMLSWGTYAMLTLVQIKPVK